MTLVSIPANPVPEDVVIGTIKTPDGAELRFARWAPPAGRKGTVCVFTGRSEQIEKYFETVRDLRDRGFAVAMIDWRGPGPFVAALARSAQGLCARFLRFRNRRRNLRAAGGAAGLPAALFRAGAFDGRRGDAAVAHAGKRWFDRMVLSAPMIDLPGRRHLVSGARAVAHAAARRAGRPLRSGGSDAVDRLGSFINNPCTSDPVRFARNAAILGGRPDARHRLADGGLGRYRVPRDARLPRTPTIRSEIRQPILMLAASNDTIVSTAAIEEFAYHLRAGSHLVDRRLQARRSCRSRTATARSSGRRSTPSCRAPLFK